MTDNIKKPLKEWLSDGHRDSSKLSEINRSLAFAGIAIIWIFRNTNDQVHILPQALICPLSLIIVSLGFDYLQYIWKIAISYITYLYKEKQYDNGNLTDKDIEDVTINSWLSYITWIFFLCKLVSLVFAYAYIYGFLFAKL